MCIVRDPLSLIAEHGLPLNWQNGNALSFSPRHVGQSTRARIADVLTNDRLLVFGGISYLFPPASKATICCTAKRNSPSILRKPCFVRFWVSTRGLVGILCLASTRALPLRE